MPYNLAHGSGGQAFRDNRVTFFAFHLLRSVVKESTMLRWALIFLIVALVAGVLGFGVVEGTAAWIAKVLFVVFIILFIIGLISGRRPMA